MVRAAATPEAVRTPPYGFRVPQQNASVRQHRLGLRDRLPEHQEDVRNASGGISPLFYRTDKNAMASTTSHPTMIKEATAPVVILGFSFVV